MNLEQAITASLEKGPSEQLQALESDFGNIIRAKPELMRLVIAFAGAQGLMLQAKMDDASRTLGIAQTLDTASKLGKVGRDVARGLVEKNADRYTEEFSKDQELWIPLFTLMFLGFVAGTFYTQPAPEPETTADAVESIPQEIV